MNGYFLEGVDGELLLVVKTEDREALLRILQKLAKSREKNTKQLFSRLEMEFYERFDK